MIHSTLLAATADSSISGSFFGVYSTAILALLGTLIGASVGAFTTWWTTKTSLKSSRKTSLLELRREEYFSAIEIVYRMERALLDMAASLSGRRQPGILASRARKKEADASDRAAAAAIEELHNASKELDLEVYRLGAVGSKRVQSQLKGISATVFDYMESSFGDGRFVASRFQEALERYQSLAAEFVEAIRVDLEVDLSLDSTTKEN
ncbi:MAG: hypothetical protein QMB98_05010 [Flaviflexus sp.]|uniref:hypothetical protein n=1 Tax=Flaviflexus sp. TaxID=1969482 RepID=UPI00352D0510